MGLTAAAEATGPVARLVSVSGRGIAWLTLLMTLLTFMVVVLRYGLNAGWIWMQESVTYLHAAVFMVAAAWTLQADEHVRVDIFYREASERYRLWVNLLGTLVFLLPFSLFMLYIGWDYVAASWMAREGSREAGGLPLVWLLKSLIVVLPFMLLLQSGVTVAACLRGLRSGADD